MTKLSSPIELIKKSINIFSKKENFIFFAKIYVLLLPFDIFNLFQGLMLDQNAQPKNVWFTLIIVVVNILNFLVYVLVSVAGIIAVQKVIEGGKLNFKNTLVSAWKKYKLFFLLTILVGLITGLGFILLIVPGVLFLVWFSFSHFIIVEDKIGIKGALSKSKELVKDRFWKVFGILALFGILSWILGQAVEFIPYGIGSAVDTLLGGLYILPFYLLYKELSA